MLSSIRTAVHLTNSKLFILSNIFIGILPRNVAAAVEVVAILAVSEVMAMARPWKEGMEHLTAMVEATEHIQATEAMVTGDDTCPHLFSFTSVFIQCV